MRTHSEVLSLGQVVLCAVVALHVPAVAGTAQNKEKRKVAKFFEKAEELQKAGEFEKAIVAYLKADEAADGTSWASQVALARLYLQQRSPEESLQSSERARDSAGSPPERAIALELAGRAQETLSLQMSDEDAEAHKVEALRQAAVLFEEALEASPDAAIDSLYYLGTIRERQGDAGEARQLYTRYRDLNPRGEKIGPVLLHLDAFRLPVEERPRYVTGSMSPPIGLSKPSPQYTQAARRARTRGVIALEAIIDTSGRVAKLALLNELPDGLTEAAIAAVRQWTFEPARLADGTPVPVYYGLSIGFDLQ